MTILPTSDTASATPSKFLNSITIQQEPAELLGRFFLMAADQAAERGIFLELGTFEDLMAVNEKNLDSWMPITTTFRPDFARTDDGSGIVVLGRDADGRVVTTHAVRRFDWHNTNLQNEAESLRLFYQDPRAKAPNEFFSIDIPEAREITGTVAYTGAVWMHPDVRGGGRAQFIARAARALALAQWNVDWICSLYSPLAVQRNFAARTGYRDMYLDAAEAGYSPIAPEKVVKLALVRTTALAFIDDLFGLMLRMQLSSSTVEVNREIHQRRA